MRITQNGNDYIATHIGGPTHNLLGFSVEMSEAREDAYPVFVLDEPSDDWPLNAVKNAVMEGIHAAGGPGAASIRSIRVIGSDTPTSDIYRWLAFRLTQHVREQHVAVPMRRVAG